MDKNHYDKESVWERGLVRVKSDSMLQPLVSEDANHSVRLHPFQLPKRPVSTLPCLPSDRSWNSNDLFGNMYHPNPDLHSKISEAATIDNMFAKLEPDSCLPSPTSLSAILSSETETLLDEESEPFNSDLARILLWFRRDLSDSQKFSVLLALIQSLEPWQVSLVNDLVKLGKSTGKKGHTPAQQLFLPAWVDGDAYSHRANEEQQYVWSGGYPTGLINSLNSSSTVQSAGDDVNSAASNGPFSPSFTFTSGSIDGVMNGGIGGGVNGGGVNGGSINGGGGGLFVNPNAELFYDDIPAWLRSLRLHKYTAALGHLSPQRLVSIESEGELEALGVTAMGARNKLLRLFEAIRAVSNSH